MSNRSDLTNPDEFDTLTEIWIMACTDENPIMTYKGIAHRLEKTVEEVENIVKKRRDLFRPSIPSKRLEAWKRMLIKNIDNDLFLPPWIAEIKERESKESAINGLKHKEHVFRSQFRKYVVVEKEDSEKKKIEDRDLYKSPEVHFDTIKWGIEHIDRLRKVQHEGKQLKWTTRFSATAAFVSVITVILSALTFCSNTTKDASTSPAQKTEVAPSANVTSTVQSPIPSQPPPSK